MNSLQRRHPVTSTRPNQSNRSVGLAGCASAHRRGYTLLLVLTFLAVMSGVAAVFTLRTANLIRTDRIRTLDGELRQMIDAGVTYANLHRDAWPVDDPPLVLDTSHMTNGERLADVTLVPEFDSGGTLHAVRVTAHLYLPHKKTRSLTVLARLRDSAADTGGDANDTAGDHSE